MESVRLFEKRKWSRMWIRIVVVGSLGFEPRIANAPGWYTEPIQPSVAQYNHQMVAIRRPQQDVPYAEQINKTLDKAIAEGKTRNTVNSFRQRLTELTHVADLMKPEDIKQAIGYAKLANSSKQCFALAYEWFTKTNGLKWEKPRFKWELGTPIIPTTDQVNKIISATTTKFATIFKLMANIGIEGEELHQTHRNQFDPSQDIFAVKGLKGHSSANYKLKPQTAEMLKAYLAKYTQEYPFPQTKVVSDMWRRARNQAAKNHNDKTLLNIPMKNLRNYSGAQFWYNFPDPIGVMRHMRHKRMETTMHYLKAIVLDAEAQYDVKIAETPEQIADLVSKGYTREDEINGKHVYKKRK